MPTVTTYPGVFGPYTPITFTRTSGATYFDSNGVLQTAGNNVPRLDYNPITLAAQGLLIEEQRTNSIRNNTMVGAVAGTPGTLPTNWNISGLGTLNQQVVAVSTINGINYIDLRFSGTTSTTQLSIRSEPGGTGAIAAANGQTWTFSMWSAIIAGNLTNINSYGYGTLAYDAVGSFIGAPFSNGTINTNSTLTRTQATGTIATVGTAFIQPQIYFIFNSGVAIDITLRIGLPQLERGAFATSVIPTVNAFALGVTREADQASVNTLSPWYNATEGTLFAQASLISSSYSQGVLVDLGAGGAFGTTEYVNWSGTGWILNPNTPPINVTSTVITTPTAKVAVGLKTNDSVISANGLIGTTDTSCGIVAAPTTLSIGKAGWALGNYFNGWIQRITYYPRRLSNAELQAITA